MNKTLLYILLGAAAVLAIGGATVPNTFAPNTLARSATVNENFDSLELAVDRVADTLNLAVPRWATFQDTVIDSANFGTVNVSIIDGNPYADSLMVGYISGDTADFDTVLAGYVNATVLGATSLSSTAGNITTFVFDSAAGGDLGADSVGCTKINTGIGWTEVQLMDQNVRSSDAVAFTTVNTGNGANELYPMNQAVRTTDDVVFDSLALTDLRVADDVTILDRMTVSGITTLDSVVAGDVGADSVGCTKINTGNGWVEAYPMNQDVQSTASPTFVNGTFTGNATLGDGASDAHRFNGAVGFGADAASERIKLQTDTDVTGLFMNNSVASYTANALSMVHASSGGNFAKMRSVGVDRFVFSAEGDLTASGALSCASLSTGNSTFTAANPTLKVVSTSLTGVSTLGIYSQQVGTTIPVVNFLYDDNNNRASIEYNSNGLKLVENAAGTKTIKAELTTSLFDVNTAMNVDGALSCASLSTTGNATIGSLTTDTLSGITTIAGDWYRDTTFACTLSRVGYTSTLSYNATYKDSIGTCRIVKTGANYNMYLYGFSAMVSASGFGLMYLNSVLPVAWRPNESYSGMIGDNGGANFATWSYDPSSYKILFSFETSNSMWLTGLNINYTR